MRYEIKAIDRFLYAVESYSKFIKNWADEDGSKFDLLDKQIDLSKYSKTTTALLHILALFIKNKSLFQTTFPVFTFANTEIFEEIIDSRLSGLIPFGAINPPLNNGILSLPKKIQRRCPNEVVYYYDLVFFSICPIETDLTCKKYTIIFINSSSTNEEYGIVAYNKIFKPTDKLTEDDFVDQFDIPIPRSGDNIKFAAEDFRLIIKIFLFINSISSEIQIIREYPNSNAPNSIKNGIHTFRRIQLSSKIRKIYEIQADPTGKHQSVRYPVRGNFAHFTKGKLAGRILWRPPHWRGPEIGKQIIREYCISRGDT